MLQVVEHPQQYTEGDSAFTQAETIGPEPQRVGLARVVAHHKREAHRAHRQWVYEQAKADQPLEQILATIAA